MLSFNLKHIAHMLVDFMLDDEAQNPPMGDDMADDTAEGEEMPEDGGMETEEEEKV